MKMKKDIYAIYHGRFSEMLLAHFDNSIKISSIDLTKYDYFES